MKYFDDLANFCKMRKEALQNHKIHIQKEIETKESILRKQSSFLFEKNKYKECIIIHNEKILSLNELIRENMKNYVDETRCIIKDKTFNIKMKQIDVKEKIDNINIINNKINNLLVQLKTMNEKCQEYQRECTDKFAECSKSNMRRMYLDIESEVNKNIEKHCQSNFNDYEKKAQRKIEKLCIKRNMMINERNTLLKNISLVQEKIVSLQSINKKMLSNKSLPNCTIESFDIYTKKPLYNINHHNFNNIFVLAPVKPALRGHDFSSIKNSKYLDISKIDTSFK